MKLAERRGGVCVMRGLPVCILCWVNRSQPGIDFDVLPTEWGLIKSWLGFSEREKRKETKVKFNFRFVFTGNKSDCLP